MKTKSKILIHHFLSFTMVLNQLTLPFISTGVFADTKKVGAYEIVDGKLIIPDAQIADGDTNSVVSGEAAHSSVRNKAQWDGALLIQGFALPTVDKDEHADGTPQGDERFTDSTKKTLKNEVYLQDMVTGYSKSDSEAHLEKMNEYHVDPFKIQDDSATEKILKETYKNIECDTLEFDDEKAECERIQVALIMDSMRQNEGRGEFLGSVDSIITASEGFIDADHPFVTEMFNDECIEIANSEDAEEKVLTKDFSCSAEPADRNDVSIKAERYIESSFVETKTLMSYVGDGNGFEVLRIGVGDEERLTESVNRAFFNNRLPWGDFSGDATMLNNTNYYYIDSCEADNGALPAPVSAERDLDCIYIEMSNTYEYNQNATDAEVRLRQTGFELQLDPGVTIMDVDILEVSEVPQMYYAFADQSALNEVNGAVGSMIPWSRLSYDYNRAQYSVVPTIQDDVALVNSYNDACGALDSIPNTEFATFVAPEACTNVSAGGNVPVDFVSRYRNGSNWRSRNDVSSNFYDYSAQVREDTRDRTYEDTFSLFFTIPEYIGDPSSKADGYSNATLAADGVYFDSRGGNVGASTQLMRTNLRLKLYLSQCQEKSVPLCSGGTLNPETLGATCGPESYRSTVNGRCKAGYSPQGDGPSTLCVLRATGSYCPETHTKEIDADGNSFCQLIDAQCGVSPEDNTIVSVPAIDDISAYPKLAVIDFSGLTVPVEVTAWDIDTYPVDRFFPANLRVEGDFVLGFEVISIGSPTNKYTYKLAVQLSKPSPFEVKADLHELVDTGFTVVDGDAESSLALQYFLDSAYPADAECTVSLTDDDVDFVTAGGISISNATTGYLSFMDGWGDNGNPPLSKLCWEADILVKAGFGNADDKTIECQGLDGDAYTQCLEGKWCKYDEINGETICYDTSEGIMSGFEASCSAYVNDPLCTHNTLKTYCETYQIDENGDSVCSSEVHIFECEIAGSQYSVPKGKDTSTICGGPVECIGGECTNIEDEANSAFAGAATQGQLISEFSQAESCNESLGGDTSSCKLFQGEYESCSKPLLHATTNCCNPDEVGFGQINAFDYYNAVKLMSDSMEGTEAAAWMSQAWTESTDYVSGTDIAQGIGATADYIAEGAGAAANYLVEPMQTGFDSFMKTLGIDYAEEAAGEIVNEIGDAAVQEMTQEAANQAIESGQEVAAQSGESIFSGIYQYVAQGVYELVHLMAPDLAEQIFTVGAENTAEAGVVQGFQNEALNQSVEILGDLLFYYSMYKLVVGIVYACDEADLQTTLKIQTLRANYLDSRCKDKVLGQCIAKSQRYCTYNSPYSAFLAREIGEQKAEQANMSEAEYWRDRDCRGFSLDDLETVDWDRIDDDEFTALVMQKMQFDPNNMPEDYVPSDVYGGFSESGVLAQGEHAGTSAIESNINVVTVTAQAAEANRDANIEAPAVTGNPNYMAWFEQPEGTTNLCRTVCPVDYVLKSSSGLCEKETSTFADATMTCDEADGYTYDPDEGRCMKYEYTSLIGGCPSGYQLNTDGNVCSRSGTNIVDYTTECIDGLTFNGETNQCEQTATVAIDKDCTYLGAGFSLENGICVSNQTLVASPDITCPVNHTLVDGMCVVDRVEAYVIECPFGQVLNTSTGLCQYISENKYQAEPTCNDGYLFDADLQYCIQVNKEIGILVCDVDNGWTFSNGLCEKPVTQSVPSVLVCPTGSSLNATSQLCEMKAEIESITPTCPSVSDAFGDYTLSDSGYCYRDVTISKPAEVKCRTGFDVDGTECVQRLTSEVRLVCDQSAGYVLNVATETCVLEDEVSSPATASCSEGTLVDEVCEVVATETTTPQCPQQYLYNEPLDICEFKQFRQFAPVVTCEAGYIAKGTQCYQTTSVEPVAICPVGTLNIETGLCESDELKVVGIITTCPVGLYLEGNVCKSTDRQSGTPSCEYLGDEFIYDEAAKQCKKGAKLFDEPMERCDEAPNDDLVLCQNEITKAPSYNCQAGYYYDASSEQCHNGTNQFTEPIIVCNDPENWSYNASTKVCEKTINADGTQCHTGFEYNDTLGVCEETLAQNAERYCPTGFAYINGECRIALYQEPMCEDGYSFNGTTDSCEKAVSQPADITCPPGFTINPATLECELAQAEVLPECPSFSTYSNDSDDCVLEPVSYIEDVCGAGFSFDGESHQCVKVVTQTPQCPVGSFYQPTSKSCVYTAYTTEQYCNTGTFDGTNCITVENKLPNCASSYFFNVDTQKCQREDSIDGDIYCPLNELYPTKLESGMCIYFEFTERLSNGDCQIGYFLNEQAKCVKYVKTTLPQYDCPNGYLHPLSEAGEPVLTSPICLAVPEQNPTCDLGYSLVGGFCHKQHEASPQLRCSIDGQYVYGDACQSDKRAAPECPASERFSAESNMCTSMYYETVERRCPANYHLSGDQARCVGNAPIPAKCPSNFVLNTFTNTCQEVTQSPNCPAGYAYNSESNNCEKWIEQNANFHCLGDSYQTAEGCVFFESATCETGYSLDTTFDECRKHETSAATPYCIDGLEEEVNGQCVPYVDLTCATGYTFNPSTDKCEKYQTSDVIDTCPSGAVWNDSGLCEYRHAPNCSDTYSYNTATDRCERLDSQDASLLCEDGYSYYGSDGCRKIATPTCNSGYTYRADMDACYKNTQQSTTQVCYGNTDTGSFCLNITQPTCNSGYGFVAANDRCERLVSHEEEYTCPDGALLQGTQCVTQQTPTCSSGYTFVVVNDRCEKLLTHEETYSCSADARLTGTSCITQSTPTCASGYSFVVANDRCERLLTHEETYSCPTGSRLIGTQCVFQRTPVCGNGFTFVVANDRCERFLNHEESYSCPSGSRLDGTQCIGQETPVCPSGYSYVQSADRCERLLTHEETYSCNASSRLSGTNCYAQQTPTCDPGYAFIASRDRCEKLESHEETYTCSAGQRLQGYQCISQQTPSCSSGYTYVAGNDRCEQLLTQEETYSCPTGYRNTGSACIQQQTPSCNSGYSFIESRDRCEKLETAEESYSCGAGYRLIGDQCRQQQTPTCDNDYTYSSSADRCEKDESQAAAGGCPTGYLDNGIECESTTTTTSSGTCPSGKVMKNGMCAVLTKTGVNACPKWTNFKTSPRRCENRGEIYPMCQDYLQQFAWDIYYDSGDWKCMAWDDESTPLCGSNAIWDEDSELCRGTARQPYEAYSCPNATWTLSGSTCSRTLTHSPNCNSGFSYNSDLNKCEKSTTIDASVICPAGGYSFVPSTSRCERVLTHTPSCSSGFSYSGAYNKCEKNTSIAQTVNCPTYYTFESGDSRCELLNTTVPSCSSGYNYSATYNQCESQTPLAATVNCSGGYTYNGSSSKCERTLTDSVNCTSGYAYNNSYDKCEVTSPTSATIVCNADYSYSAANDRCERLLTLAPQCGVGFAYNATLNQCESTGNYDATVNCNSGYSFDTADSRCELFQTTPPICDVGYTYNATQNQCESNNKYNGTVNCNSGYTFVAANSRCERLLTSSPTCPTNYSYQSSQNRCEANSPYDAQINCNSLYTFNSGNSRCERLVTEPPVCSGGFSYDASRNECEADVHFNATINCDPSYAFNASSSKCERLLTHSPLCASGNYDSGYNACKSEVGYSYECPSDFVKRSQTLCEKEEEHAPLCETGKEYSTANNTCWDVSPSSRIYQCLDVGWVVVADQCQRLLTEPSTCDPSFSISDDLCRQPTPIVPTCSADSTNPWSVNLDVYKCDRTLLKEPVCSAGSYDPEDQRCESPAIEYHYSCETGWSLVGQTCHRTLTLPPQCNTGFAYINSADRCELILPDEFIYYCDDASWTLDAKICGKFIYDTSTCNDTYVLQDDRCRPRASIGSSEHCPFGYDLNSGACFFTDTQAPECGGPATGEQSFVGLNTLMDRCEYGTNTPLDFQCPDSWLLTRSFDEGDLVGGVCNIQSQHAPTVDCPDSFTFRPDTLLCERTDYEAREFVCPAGFDMFEDGRTCFIATSDTVPVENVSCPYDGFSLVGDICQFDYNTNVSHYCDDANKTLIINPGEVISGLSSELVCVSDTTFYEPPIFSCGDGYDALTGDTGECISNAVAEPIIRCPDDSYTYVIGTNQCEKTVVKSTLPDLICEDGYSKVGRTCIFTSKVAGELTCEHAAAELIDGICYEEVLIDTTAPVDGCSSGELVSGDCESIVYTEPNWDCPGGRTFIAATKMCVESSIDSSPAESACPLGYELVADECVKESRYDSEPTCDTLQWVMEDSTCTNSYQETVIADVCPFGATQVLDACFTVSVVAKIEGCEEYYALSDDGATCYQDRTLYEEPIVTCSDGFEVAGDICIESLQHEPSYECDDVAWTLVDDICYEDILNTEDSAAQVCPDSYVDTGTDCHLYIEVEPVIACEPGYLYSDGAQQCEKAEVVKELPQSACPVGSEDLGNGYCKTVIASATPIIECEGAINPATHQCEVAYTDEISPGYCNAPFSKEDDQCVQSRSKLPTATCPAGTTQSVTHCVSTQVETAIPTEECSGG